MKKKKYDQIRFTLDDKEYLIIIQNGSARLFQTMGNLGTENELVEYITECDLEVYHGE